MNAASCGSQSTMMLHSQLLSFRSLHFSTSLHTRTSVRASILFEGSLLVRKSTLRICGAPDTHEQFQSLPLPTSLTFLIHAVQHAGHIPLIAGTARIAETRRITTHTGGAVCEYHSPCYINPPPRRLNSGKANTDPNDRGPLTVRRYPALRALCGQPW